MTADRPLPAFDEPELRAAAAAVAGRPPGMPLGRWEAESIFAPVASATAGIWRLGGDGWSVVLKVVQHSEDGHPHWRSGRDPSHWFYWRREVLAYTTGLLDGLPDGLRAPACYLAAEEPGERVRLWLEDVGARPATGWPLDRYRVACRHLGRAQGAFPAGRPLPDDAWLSRGWLRAYLEQRRPRLDLLDDPGAWASPLLAGVFPDPPAGRLRRMWEDRGRPLAVLDRMPRTLCHFDLHPKNLFDVDGATVLIDWSFVGVGAVGEDAGNLVADAVLDFHVPPERIGALWEVAVEGYLAGLADAGWDGDPQVVRDAMAAAVAAKYGWIGPVLVQAVIERRPTLNGRPLAEAAPWWARTTAFLLELAE